MKLRTGLLVAAMPLVCALGAPTTAAARAKDIVVEPPAALPALAREAGVDMYLRDANNGSTYLYIEDQTGKYLSILNVTDPARIAEVARVSIAAQGPFDFVRELDHSAALIRYRDNSGFAVASFKRVDRPTIAQVQPMATARTAEMLDGAGLLLTSTSQSHASLETPTPRRVEPQTYTVVDVANAAEPEVLASVPGVVRRLLRQNTGTTFLLSDNGITVVRRLRTEAAHATELWQDSRN
jgi:hypothetical protein